MLHNKRKRTQNFPFNTLLAIVDGVNRKVGGLNRKVEGLRRETVSYMLKRREESTYYSNSKIYKKKGKYYREGSDGRLELDLTNLKHVLFWTMNASFKHRLDKESTSLLVRSHRKYVDAIKPFAEEINPLVKEINLLVEEINALFKELRNLANSSYNDQSSKESKLRLEVFNLKKESKQKLKDFNLKIDWLISRKKSATSAHAHLIDVMAPTRNKVIKHGPSGPRWSLSQSHVILGKNAEQSRNIVDKIRKDIKSDGEIISFDNVQSRLSKIGLELINKEKARQLGVRPQEKYRGLGLPKIINDFKEAYHYNLNFVNPKRKIPGQNINEKVCNYILECEKYAASPPGSVSTPAIERAKVLREWIGEKYFKHAFLGNPKAARKRGMVTKSDVKAQLSPHLNNA